MKYYVSPSTLGFYVDKINNHIPSDAIQLSQDVYLSLLSGVNSGYEIDFELSDQLTLKKIVSIQTIENLSKDERFWRNTELTRADYELNKVQDSDHSAVGSVGEWRTYRKALRAWPEQVGFPNKEFSPKAPDFKE